ncbi:MAG: hypothetical protein AUK55_08015 [Syntrophobacteraceae bacterium CG2_30_61_12]|nr:MAG: hypothetical protein AUK55_08015 [Syntrophobacteraceae bacterium CG2_30_61_12]PIU32728.1 MAG: hypothetical protein COT06_01170 [Syntrophobacteraceae bacterium CG07_land_8_20_14_0_80_61_8]
MLSGFDWLRRSKSGAELLATMAYLSTNPEAPLAHTEMGPPRSATAGPCLRCWIYPRIEDGEPYCKACGDIHNRARGLSTTSRNAVVLWGFFNQLPTEILDGGGGNRKGRLLGCYIHDANHFLVAINRWQVRSWLQDLTLYHGFDLRGILQIFPTTGPGIRTGMDDVLCRAIHQDLYMPMGQLQVRFFSAPYQLLKPRLRAQRGMLIFDLADFLNLLQMVEIFRALLRPEEQQEFKELASLGAKQESQFYWGRYLGRLEQRSRDMLTAWNMRQWPEYRIKVFYELLDYVPFIPAD